jgi:hypothetical protein
MYISFKVQQYVRLRFAEQDALAALLCHVDETRVHLFLHAWLRAERSTWLTAACSIIP